MQINRIHTKNKTKLKEFHELNKNETKRNNGNKLDLLK